MKLHLIFIGNKFIYNHSLKEYIIRQVEQRCNFISSVTYFKEGDNSLFLYLEEELNNQNQLIIITTKQNFSTVGKLISTVTSDNQVVKDNLLIPSKAKIFQEANYLLKYQNSILNVLSIDEMQKMPEILLNFEDSKVIIHMFEKTKEDIKAKLEQTAQTYDINFDMVEIIEGWIEIGLSSKKYGNISKFIDSAKNIFPKNLIAEVNIVKYITDLLDHKNKKITFAESCTGGLLSYYFTSQNGVSKIFEGSLITYSNILKENWLAVDHKILEDVGAVSQEVVAEMSEGALNVSSADYAISISGIAGDTGGTDEKPVGTVYIGVRSKDRHIEKLLNLHGDRNYIQHQSVLFAIKMLLQIDKETFF